MAPHCQSDEGHGTQYRTQKRPRLEKSMKSVPIQQTDNEPPATKSQPKHRSTFTVRTAKSSHVEKPEHARDASNKPEIPNAWRKALDPILYNTLDPEREARIRPFRAGILSGRLQALTNFADGTGPQALDGVDLNTPIVWRNHDFVGTDPLEIQCALENAIFGFYDGSKKNQTSGLRYEADKPNRQILERDVPNINLRILQSFRNPSMTPLYFAINTHVPGFVLGPTPEIAEREHTFQVETESSANYTPESICYAPPQDNGTRGNAHHALGPKLWVFYPPTPTNITRLIHLHTSNTKYALLEPSLSPGLYALLESSQTIQIPPGWLHATYALASSIVNGTNWWSAEGLASTALILSEEIKVGQHKEVGDVLHLLRCLKAAVDAAPHKPGFWTDAVRALRLLCPVQLGASLGDFVFRKRGNKEANGLAGEIRRALREMGGELGCESEGCGGLLEHLP
ncbi:hypothetical protein BDV95DRAFT_609958 [Massariosphaeria phaeospora]|uniref:JmjC domain-containing protein n=1 Tax=Massariosphaeria phaeospora TaxID=100035 RepID=A0A7C8M2W9_9PLEO|nr:hypothetical protein BDV95DRAFT_609958 [Massariosphaeria phaeospora]